MHRLVLERESHKRLFRQSQKHLRYNEVKSTKNRVHKRILTSSSLAPPTKGIGKTVPYITLIYIHSPVTSYGTQVLI